jgi:hypothetical protein
MKTAMLLGIMFFTTSGLLALSGYGTSSPVVNDTVDPLLSILSPNGGEAWYSVIPMISPGPRPIQISLPIACICGIE